MKYTDKRAVIQPATPISISDANGNSAIVKALSCDISISGGQINVNPDMWPLRDAIAQRAGCHDLFTINIDDDAGINELMIQLRERVEEIMADRLASV